MNTKYYLTWEEYLAEHPEIEAKEEQVMAPVMQSYEEMMLGFILNLCM
jgi:hypothetical protein